MKDLLDSISRLALTPATAVSLPATQAKQTQTEEAQEEPNEVLDWFDEAISPEHKQSTLLAPWRLENPAPAKAPRPDLASFYGPALLDRAGAEVGPALAAKTQGEKVMVTLAALANKCPNNFEGLDDFPLAAVVIALAQGIQDHPLAADLLAEFDTQQRSEMLIFSVMTGHSNLARCLLQFEVNVNSQDRLGNTALHWATITGQKSLVSQLLRLGANQDIKNDLFATPSDYGIKFGPELPVVAYLRTNDSLQPLSPDLLRQHTGMNFIDKSNCSVDFFVSLGVLAFNAEAATETSSGLPVEEASPGRSPILSIKKYQDIGWGVCATETIKENSFIGSYTGDLIHTTEHVIRERKELFPYAFTLFSNKQDILEQPLSIHLKATIDAEYSGSLVTRINSCHKEGLGNVRNILGFRQGRPVLDFYTTRSIGAGEQMAFYYGDTYWKSHGSVATMTPLTRDHDFFAPKDPIPYLSPAMSQMMKSLMASGNYLPILLDVQGFTSRKTLVGSSTRMGLLAQAVISSANTGGRSAMFQIPFIHAANTDVRECLEEIIYDNKTFFHDQFLQKDVPLGASAFLFPCRDSTKLPESSKFRKAPSSASGPSLPQS